MDDATEADAGAPNGAPGALSPALLVPAILPGASAVSVSAWFDTMVDIESPALDGSLAAEHAAAAAFQRMAKAENTRTAYRAAVAPGVPGAPCAGSLPCPPPAPTSRPSSPPSAIAGSPRTPSTCVARLSAICTAPPAARSLPTTPASPKPSPASAATPPAGGSCRARRSRRPPPSCARSWRRFPTTCAVCATARCC
jgi:hypothetical protein